MKISNILFYFSISVLMISCGRKTQLLNQKPETISSSPEKVVSIKKTSPLDLSVYIVRKTELETDLSNIDQFSKDINTYIFNIKNAKSQWEGKTVECINQMSEKKRSFTSLVEKGEASIQLSSSEYLKTIYNCSIQGETEIFSYELYKGFVIEGETSLAELLNVSTGKLKLGPIVLKPSAKIFIRDNDFFLESDVFVVLNTRDEIPEITTFYTDELTAPDSTNGLSGGFLTLNTENAYGDILKINMVGQNGGGQKMKPATPSQPPRAPACNSFQTCRRVTTCKEDQKIFPASYIPRSGGPGSGNNNCKTENVCSINYTSPERGLKAIPGLPGFTGTNGGSSGAFILNIKDQDHFKDILFKTAAGKKGKGGLGGESSLPGLGGSCPTGNGESGATAPSGQNGQDGIDGQINNSSIINLKDGRMYLSNGQ